MRRFLLAGASFCAIALTSCQDNEILENPVNQADNGKIKFAVIQDLSTKAAPGHPLNSTDALRALGSFSVVGYGTDVPILNEAYVTATPTYNGATWEYGSEPYWPDQALNFLAYAPVGTDNIGASIAPTGITKTNFQVGDNNTQLDFVVAIEPGKTKESRTMLRFRHTLTQVVFKAIKVNGSNLNVTISDIDLCNINNKGNFSVGATTPLLTQDTWTPNGNKATFNASPGTPFVVTASADAGDLKTAERILSASTPDNSLLMVPQNFKAWDTANSIIQNNNTSKEAYVRVSALITTTSTLGTPVVLWGTSSDPVNAGPKDLFIPVSSLGKDLALLTNDDNHKGSTSHYGQWVPGRRVNYVISFGDKGSGSGGGGYDGNGDPVLIPIRFTAMVEDWVDVDVPLLSATVSSNSSDMLSPGMIDGYANQVLTDMSGAQYPKNFKAQVNLTNTFATAFTPFTLSTSLFTPVSLRSIFRPGSTFSWNMKADHWGAITIPAAPTGWAWDGVSGNFTDLNSPMNSNGKVVLKKVAEPSFTWNSLIGYVDDHTIAIQKNIEGLAAAQEVTYTVNILNSSVATGKSLYMETGFLNRLINAQAGSRITYDFSTTPITGTGTITMGIPAGWTATGGERSTDGQSVSITAGTVIGNKTIVFTRTSD